jgi:alcohol dehydrogenase class IV
MPDLSFSIPTDVRFGLDVVNRIAAVVSQYGERVLLVTEAILYEGKVIDRIQGLFEKKGIQYIVFDEVVPHATSKVVDEGVNLARSARAEIIVGLGGVRTLSVAKCVAMVSPGEVDMDEYLSGVQPSASRWRTSVFPPPAGIHSSWWMNICSPTDGIAAPRSAAPRGASTQR